AGRALGARQLRLGPGRVCGAARAPVRVLEVPLRVPAVQWEVQLGDPGELPLGAGHRGGERRERERGAARRVERLLSGAAGSGGGRVHAALLRRRGHGASRVARAAARRAALAVTPAAGVVAAVVAAQAGGAAAFPGSTRAAGHAGAIFANPAALATVSRLAFDASYQRASASDTVFYAAAVATRLPRLDWGA